MANFRQWVQPIGRDAKIVGDEISIFRAMFFNKPAEQGVTIDWHQDGAGGWRLGTFTFPPGLRWLLQAMAVVASETFTSTSAPIQYAAVRAFQGGSEIERYLFHSRRILRSLGRLCARRLQSAEIEVHEPQGGFYLFPDFSRHYTMIRGRGIGDSRRGV